ncbi:hypothetical protein Arub01_01290 [Actinomadura rubrobrunea]|uniref:Uncharacterized protein n=1 Tax=Actinomadura rubrobrunea TaxID=115335 RepID=A0A9W6PP05_9ACTN|nr:hypothetical protein [Actinomadura rubrobrunea]GLW61885.1 hypothetical protein Arub01_01290 [Actinomadura rubrobrunea]
MGLRHALTVLAEQWDDIRDRLSAEDVAEVRALVEEFAREGDRAASEEIAEEIADLLRDLLPGDHPFLAALRGREERLAPDRARRAADLAAWFRLAEPLRARLVGADPPPTADEVERAAAERLLAVPALGADELRAGGQDPGDPDLIRLDAADGSVRWPDFQFAPDGSVPPVVRTVNRILDASGDPFGAADWWLGANGWLGAVPARLIGSVPDERLIAAARAEAEV